MKYKNNYVNYIVVKSLRLSRKNLIYFKQSNIKAKNHLGSMNIGKAVKNTIGVLVAAYAINFCIQAKKMNDTKYLANYSEFMDTARPVIMDIADDLGFQVYLRTKCVFNRDFKNQLERLKDLAREVKSAEPEFYFHANKMLWPFYTAPKSLFSDLEQNLLKK